MNTKSRVLRRIPNICSSDAFIFMIRHWIRQLIEGSNPVEAYDRFIVTRSGFLHRCNHDVSGIDPHYVWVPEGQDYSGITDRHVVTSARLILCVLNILEPLFSCSTSYHNPKSFDTDSPNQIEEKELVYTDASHPSSCINRTKPEPTDTNTSTTSTSTTES